MSPERKGNQDDYFKAFNTGIMNTLINVTTFLSIKASITKFKINIVRLSDFSVTSIKIIMFFAALNHLSRPIRRQKST